MTEDTGGPAFPTPAQFFSDGGMKRQADDGMTLRDYFAAKALQGALSNQAIATSLDLAGICYAIADAMLKERK